MKEVEEFRATLAQRDHRKGITEELVEEIDEEPKDADDKDNLETGVADGAGSQQTPSEHEEAISHEVPVPADDELEEEEERRPKRARLQMIESSVKNVIESLLRTSAPDAALLCKREVFQGIIESLDKSYTRKTVKKWKKNWIASDYATRPCRVDVAEVYSPSRMTKMANRLGYEAGFALDLTTVDEDGVAWDFTVASIREKALRLQRTTRPKMLMLCPPCTMFSALQNINKYKWTAEQYQTKMEEAMMHIAFSVLLALRQVEHGGYFVFEHPVGASTWQLEWMTLLYKCKNVSRVNFDFCMLWMKVTDEQGESPARKRTSINTNSAKLAAKLKKYQCDGGHRHANL